jgi:hypothetical protein
MTFYLFLFSINFFFFERFALTAQQLATKFGMPIKISEQVDKTLAK